MFGNLLIRPEASRTLPHAFELLALPPSVRGRRGLRCGLLRLLATSFGGRDFGGDFLNGDGHGVWGS
jgi:hypothetical protein